MRVGRERQLISIETSQSKNMSSAKHMEIQERSSRNHGSSKSQLPTIRSQATSVLPKNQLTSKKKLSNADISQKDGRDSSAKNSRNKTPSSRPNAQPNFNRGFPGLVSPGTQRSKELYSRNYVLDIDTPSYDVRKNQYHVNNFYKKVINKRILGPGQITPLLPHETSIMSQMTQQMTKTARFKNDTTFGMGGHHANLSKTIQDEIGADRMINDPSALESHAQPIKEEKRVVLPQLTHLHSDDSLFGGESKTIRADSILMQKGAKQVQQGFSTITDNIMNVTDMTQPYTSKHTQDNLMQLTIQESILRHSHILDPLAGNSVVSHLNTSFQLGAKDRISQQISKNHRRRSQQRRRLEVAGENELKEKPGAFQHKGTLEEVSSDSSAKRTKTESLANSSVYKELVDDLELINRQIDKEKVKAILAAPASPRSPGSEFRSRAPTQNTDGTTEKAAEEEETRLMLEDPDAHFKKLKAKIKLKVVKKYQEDKEKKAIEAAKAAEPVAVYRDKWGRIMPKKPVPRMTTNKLPNLSRLPVKKPPPKRKLSFTESQLKYYGANDVYNPLKQPGRGPTLTEQQIVKFMDQIDRFPIPEALVGRTQNQPYQLTIDSIIKKFYTMESVEENANERAPVGAPYNSLESDEEFQLEESQSSEDPNSVPYITVEKLRQDPTLAEKNFDVRILENNPFRLEAMKYFPFRSREGEIPSKLLKVRKLSFLLDQVPKIEEQLHEDPWSNELIQNVFEHYCMEMKAAPITIATFYNYDDPKHTKLSFKNYQLDDATAKALAMVLPYIRDIVEIDFGNNQMTDQVSTAIVMAIFANPKINRMTIAYNYLRSTFSRTLAKLITIHPQKLTDLNLMGSIIFNDHIDPLIRELPKMPYLTNLNIAGCALTGASCRNLSLFMIKCFTLRVMDVSHCRVSYQGTRYLIDALNRNTCIRNFNFSHNDLNSQSYEFSIKVASIITRHPCLMHLDITNTNLKREEIMFIAFAIPLSKTLLSIHLTAQRLPYYERVFLRAQIAAKVNFKQKAAGQKKDIKSNKDKNQVISMANGEVFTKELAMYEECLRDLDDKRKGLDFELQDLLMEINTEETFEKLDPEEAKLEDLPEDSKIGQLVNKLIERQKEVEEEQKKLQEIYEQEKVNISNRMAEMDGLSDLGKEFFEAFGDPTQQKNVRKPQNEADMFQKMRELRVERHQQRAEIEVMKENKDRSAGELALMFMGINQVAYSALMENPMTGYMNEIIFSRVLGHDDIEEGAFWVDTTQCWVCHKWNKVIVAYNPLNDKEIFTQKVFQLEKLKVTIDNLVQEGMDKERLAELRAQIEVVDGEAGQTNGKIEEVPEEFEQTIKPSANVFNQTARAGHQGFNRDESPSQLKRMMTMGAAAQQDPNFTAFNSHTGSNDHHHHEQSEVIDEAGFLHSEKEITEESHLDHKIDLHAALRTTDLIAPTRTTDDHIKSFVFPKDLKHLEEQQSISYPMPSSEQMYPNELRQLEYLEDKFDEIEDKYYGTTNSKTKNKIKVTPVGQNPLENFNDASMTLQRHYLDSKGNTSLQREHTLGAETSVISHHEVRRRKRGDPVIIQRQVFFQGVIYQIEEELFPDSDNSSVYSSEDDFDVDKGIQKRFKLANPHFSDQNSLDTSSFAERMFSKKSPPETSGGDVTPTESKGDLTPKTPMMDRTYKGKQDSKDASFKRKNSVLSKISKKEVPPQDAGKKVKNKAFSKEKQALMREYFTNTPGLTKDQREYESKLLPKFYIPELAEKRMQTLKENYPDKVNATIVPERRESQMKRKQSISPQRRKTQLFRPEEKEVFCVASFNDWMPARMKTLRRLNLERFQMAAKEDDIPKKVTTMDNITMLCANMVPPGEHYFYFVRDKGQVFLSPQYEVVKFKATNIFLNRVIVGKRLEDMETVHVAKDGEIEEEIFMKDRSVFKDYREDTQAHLKKCFDSDMAFSKIIKCIKKGAEQEAEFNAVKEYLFENYVRIINIFDYYSGASSLYPLISFNDFTSFAKRCKIIQAEEGLADFDLIVVATAVSNNQYVNSQTLDLNRYEFFEIMVRMANFYYKERNKVKTTCQGIERVLEDLIYPNAKWMDGENFRRYHCYNVRVNEILKKNEAQLMKVYKSFTHSTKQYITNEECAGFVIRKLNLDVSEMMVGACYAESMMTIIDPIKDPSKTKQMKYVEFLVFLCRVVHEHYNGTRFEKELLYVKLDHLMPVITGYLGLQPLFLFNKKFAIEEEEDKLKHKRKKRQLKKAMKVAKETGKQVDPKLLAEVTKYEQNLQKTGQGGFKTAQLGGKMNIQFSDSSDDSFSGEGEMSDFDRDDNATPIILEDLDGEDDPVVIRDTPKNLDLAQDVGASGPIGVIIPPPSKSKDITPKLEAVLEEN